MGMSQTYGACATYGICTTCGAYATNGTCTVQRKRDVVNISFSASPRKKKLKSLAVSWRIMYSEYYRNSA